MSSENHQPPFRSSFYYVIPAHIMDSEDLLPAEKLLYCLLSGLADQTGACFPSDEYLSARMRDSVSTIKRHLKHLEDLGLISRHTHSCPTNPFKKYRIITVRTDFKKSLRRLTGEPIDGGAGEPPVVSPVSLIVSEGNIESEEREAGMPTAPSVPPPFRKKPKEEKKEVVPNVWMNPTQEADLLRRLGGDALKRTACYEKLSVWKIAKGKTTLNDYANIVKWVIGAVEEDQKKPKTEDQALCDKVWIQKLPKHPDIAIGHNYIEFNLGAMNHPHLKFGEHGFKEQVENCLRKMGLPMP